MSNSNYEKLHKFVYDPDWHAMEAFIRDAFDVVTDIKAIDTTRHPETIAAEVIAIQRISETLENLFSSFQSIKSVNTNKVTFK